MELDENELGRALDQLAERRWVESTRLWPLNLAAALREDLVFRYRSGAFRAAGVGRADGHRFDSEIRSDSILWLDPAGSTGPQATFWKMAEILRERLNREFFLGLNELEAHYAIYPPGSAYKKHVDRFQDSSSRKISFVLYLNNGWSDPDGGHLRLYDPMNPDRIEVELAPMAPRLVLFSSSEVWHEVLPTRRERCSVTGWFR